MKRDWGAALPLILFTVGAVASICLLLLFAYAPDLRDESSNQADALSRSAIGFAGLHKLIEAAGMRVELDRGVAAGQSAHPGLTILMPPPGTSRQDWLDYQEQGPVLIILPKWTVATMPFRRAWVMKQGALPVAALDTMIAPVAPLMLLRAPGDHRGLVLNGDPQLKGLPLRLAGNIQLLQLLSRKPAGVPLLLVTDPRAPHPFGLPVLVRVRGGDKPVYILTEPDLMNNQGLSDKSKAQAALAIIQGLRRGAGPVRMDLTLNGMGRAPNLLKALFQPPFRGATLCAFLAALLMALHALARFGAPVSDARMVVRGKRALADNTAALVRMMGREAGMATRYVQASRDMVLARLGRRSGHEQEAVLAVLEKRAGSDMHYEQLAAQAAQAKTGSDLMRIAAMAYAWRGRITGEH